MALCRVRSEQPAGQTALSVHGGPVCGAVPVMGHEGYVVCAVPGLNSLQSGLHHRYTKDLFVVPYDLCFVPCWDGTACRSDCIVST